MDIPHLLFGAVHTPINWVESIIESIFISILGLMIIFFTNNLLQSLKNLEGILQVCASCKKIRNKKNNWYPIEAYIRDRSDVNFSHSICPDCAKELYMESKLNKDNAT